MDRFASEQVSWYYWALAAAVGCLIAIKFLRKKPNLPPSPGALPIVGSFPFLGARPGEPVHRMFARMGEKFGPITYLLMGAKPTIVVSSGEVAKLVLKDLDHVFASRPNISVGKYLGLDFNAVVFAPHGPHWTRMRKIYNVELLTPKRVTDGHAAREKGVFQSLGAVYQQHKEGAVVNLSSTLFDLGLNLILGMIFGWKDGKPIATVGKVELSELKAVIREVVERGGEFNFGDYITIVRWLDLQGVIRRLRKLNAQMQAISDALVEEYKRSGRRSPNSPDATILDRLLSLEGDDKLSMTALAGSMFDLIIAGSDTVAASADWTIAELLRQPELVQRLQAELDSVVGKDRFVTEADIPSLPFLEAVVKESLRLHPPGTLGLPHFSMADCQVAGYDIPAGTTTLLNLWAIGRDPKHWCDPNHFSPDRFFMQEEDISLFGSAYHLLPFSSGRRGCPGMHLGLKTVHLFVGSFVHAFEFQAAGELTSSNKDIDVINERPGIVSTRAIDLCCNANPRLNPSLYE